MTATRKRVSVICPALNEEDVLPHFHRELSSVLDTLSAEYEFEIVYVDDGSTDGTLELMRDWAGADSRVRYVSLSRNFGHQAAFTAGMEHAVGDALVLMDSDLQHPPALIPELLAGWRAGHDLVITLRDGGRPRGARQLAARCFLSLMRRLSPLRMRETMSDFALLSRRVTDDLLRLRETHRYLRGLIQWLGYSAGEVHYSPPSRPAGTTKFTTSRLFGYSLDAIVSFSRVPLRLAFLGGGICLFIGLGAVGRGVLGALRPEWRAGSGMAWLLASIHLVGGAVLCGLGLVGEYVGRIFEQVKSRPLYLVRETEQAAVTALPGPRLLEMEPQNRRRRRGT